MGLRRELSLFDVYCIATGAMISSGLFILPGIAHAKAGGAVIFSYFIAGLLTIPGMMSEAELVSAMPKAGGTYFFVTRSMGPAAGTINGLIIWFSLLLKSAFALVGMAAFASLIIQTDIRAVGVILTAVFVTINFLGVKEAGRLQNVLVIGLLAILVIYIVRGAQFTSLHNLTPFAPFGLTGVLSTTGFVFISYGGLLKITSIAEEATNPARNLPLAMLLSLMTVIIVYTTAIFVTSGVLGPDLLNHSLTPISDGAESFMGQKGRLLVSIAALFAFISTANAGIMAASRYPLALARDNMLPSFLGRINKRYGTPHTSILMSGIIITFFLFLKLDFLVKTASTVLIISFVFSCLSIIVMRESGIQNYRPKFKTLFYPWLQIGGIIIYCLLIFEMGREALVSSLTLICCGLFVYWFYGRVRSSREFALLNIITKITAKELSTRDLETELKDIIRERDDIIKDRFDTIIENSLVINIEEPMKVDAFFRLAAEKLAPRLDTDSDTIVRLLLEREKENSTIIAPGLAIPHIIVEGEGKFDILLARSKPGIVFSEKFNDIKTVFILAGTRDERNFHLRALSAIAQIIHFHQFPKRWFEAASEEAMRDVILLGRRKRV